MPDQVDEVVLAQLVQEALVQADAEPEALERQRQVLECLLGGDMEVAPIPLVKVSLHR